MSFTTVLHSCGALDLPSPDKHSGAALSCSEQLTSLYFLSLRNTAEQSALLRIRLSPLSTHRGKLSAWIILKHKPIGTAKPCGPVSNHCIIVHTSFVFLLCAHTPLIHAGTKDTYILLLPSTEEMKHYGKTRAR